jgi:hypothetical protein
VGLILKIEGSRAKRGFFTAGAWFGKSASSAPLLFDDITNKNEKMNNKRKGKEKKNEKVHEY